MSRDTAAGHHETRPVHGPARLAVIVLVAVGLSLVGAGAVLWSRHGSTVFVDNPVLAALAWCLGAL